MNIKVTTKLLATLFVLLIVIPVVSVGCQEKEQLPPTSSSSALSSTLVPNTNLDVYIYIKQDAPTTLPADMIEGPFDIVAESLAIWGIPAEDDFAFGGGLTLTSADDASKLHAQIARVQEMWTILSVNTIYFVEGSGIAAETLKTSISENDFKYYDDEQSLRVAAVLPTGGDTKLAAVAIVKPSKVLIGRIAKNADPEALGLINMVLKVAGFNRVVAGLYSPHQIDVAEIARVIGHGGSISESDLAALIVVKFNVPGLIVQPIAKRILAGQGYLETTLGELTIYKGFLDTDGDNATPVLVRIEDNYIFIAISGQEPYAQTLITSVNT